MLLSACSNQALNTYLKTLGLASNSTPDLLYEFFLGEGLTGSLVDMENDYLDSLGFDTGALADKWLAYLTDKGYTTGSVSDRLLLACLSEELFGDFIQNVRVATNVDNIELDLAGGILFPANLAHASSIENIILDPNFGEFELDNLTVITVADNITLLQTGTLSINDVASASFTEEVTLFKDGEFIIQEATSASTTENITLQLEGNFVIQDTTSASANENVTLTFGGGEFVIGDVTSASVNENVTLESGGETGTYTETPTTDVQRYASVETYDWDVCWQASSTATSYAPAASAVMTSFAGSEYVCGRKMLAFDLSSTTTSDIPQGSTVDSGTAGISINVSSLNSRNSATLVALRATGTTNMNQYQAGSCGTVGVTSTGSRSITLNSTGIARLNTELALAPASRGTVYFCIAEFQFDGAVDGAGTDPYPSNDKRISLTTTSLTFDWTE